MHLLADMKSNKNSRTSMSRSSSELEICPATFEEKRTLLQKNDNPWAVEQSNENSRMFEDEVNVLVFCNYKFITVASCQGSLCDGDSP